MSTLDTNCKFGRTGEEVLKFVLEWEGHIMK